MSWTDERVGLLTRLWSEGHSASQIAGQLGGVTRNAVIGKVHRLKLEGRVKPAMVAQESVALKPVVAPPAAVQAVVDIDVPARVVASQASMRGVGRSLGGMQGATALKLEPEIEMERVAEPQRAMVTGEVVPISRNLTLVQLSERTCKWPLGDPLSPDFRFCGNHSNDASPYCLYHARIAFQPVSERRRVR